MPLRLADPRDADWLVEAARADPQVVTHGPQVYAAYARLRFVPDPIRPHQDETDAEVPEDHPTEVEQIDRALWRLRHHTTTPDDCRLAIWDGWPLAEIQRLAAAGVSTVEIPDRRCVLHTGGIGDAADLEYRPAFVWPLDRSWCLTCDVDPHWGVVGGSRPAIDALLSSTDLDVVLTAPGERPPTYY